MHSRASLHHAIDVICTCLLDSGCADLHGLRLTLADTDSHAKVCRPFLHKVQGLLSCLSTRTDEDNVVCICQGEQSEGRGYISSSQGCLISRKYHSQLCCSRINVTEQHLDEEVEDDRGEDTPAELPPPGGTMHG